MSVDIRRLSDELRRSLVKGQGARLTHEDTDIALAALRGVAANAERRDLKNGSQAFQIELMDDQGWPIEALATIVDGAVAHATYAAAVKQRPERMMRLRRVSYPGGLGMAGRTTEVTAKTERAPSVGAARRGWQRADA